ncbi:MAG: hypothetical protein HY270_05570 [Deltaproteobacteria bacterium]|nr:hypothetical protein [Deltaproteobacteria bacterium]
MPQRSVPAIDEPELPAREHPRTEGYEAHSVHMRFKVIASDRGDISRMVGRYGAALGTTLTFSHIMRAWVNILKHSEKELLRGLDRASLKRPPNEDPVALADYEHKLAHVFLEALRNAPPLIRSERG